MATRRAARRSIGGHHGRQEEETGPCSAEQRRGGATATRERGRRWRRVGSDDSGVPLAAGPCGSPQGDDILPAGSDASEVGGPGARGTLHVRAALAGQGQGAHGPRDHCNPAQVRFADRGHKQAGSRRASEAEGPDREHPHGRQPPTSPGPIGGVPPRLHIGSSELGARRGATGGTRILGAVLGEGTGGSAQDEVTAESHVTERVARVGGPIRDARGCTSLHRAGPAAGAGPGVAPWPAPFADPFWARTRSTGGRTTSEP